MPDEETPTPVPTINLTDPNVFEQKVNELMETKPGVTREQAVRVFDKLKNEQITSETITSGQITDQGKIEQIIKEQPYVGKRLEEAQFTLDEDGTGGEEEDSIQGLVDTVERLKEQAKDVSVITSATSRLPGGVGSRKLQEFETTKALVGDFLIRLIADNRITDQERQFYQDRVLNISPIGLQSTIEGQLNNLVTGVVALSGGDPTDYGLDPKTAEPLLPPSESSSPERLTEANKNLTASIAAAEEGEPPPEEGGKVTKVEDIVPGETPSIIPGLPAQGTGPVAEGIRAAGDFFYPDISEFSKALSIGEATPEQAKAAAEEAAISVAIDIATMGILSKAGPVFKRTLAKIPGAKLVRNAIDEVGKASVDAKVWASAFTIPTKLFDNLKPIQTADEMLRYGVKGTLESMQETAERITGQSGILSRAVRRALGRTKAPIVADDFMTGARKMIEQSADIIDSPKAENAILKNISAGLKQTKGIFKMTADDAFDKVRTLEKLAAERMQSSTPLNPNAKAEAIARIYYGAADDLLASIDNAVNEQGIVKEILNEGTLDEVRKVVPKLADDLAEAETVAEMRAAQSGFVRLSRMINFTNAYAHSALQQTMKTQGGRAAAALAGFGIANVPGAIAGFAAAPMVGTLADIARAPIATSTAAGLRGLGTVAQKGLPAVPPALQKTLGPTVRGGTRLGAQTIRALLSQ